MVEVTGFEPAASWSQTTRATNCATPGYRGARPKDAALKYAFKDAQLQMLVYYTTSVSVCQSENQEKPKNLCALTGDESSYTINNIMLCKEAPAQNRDIQKNT